MAMTREDARRREIGELLPWYAAGTLDAAEARRVEAALAGDPELARDYAIVQEELAETILLNETLGAPSSRAMETLFAKIDAEGAPRRAGSAARRSLGIWARGRVAAVRPAVLGWAAAAAVLLLTVQGGFLAALLLERSGQYETASGAGEARGGEGTFVLVAFQPGASAADISALLESNKLSIVEGPRAGALYRVRVGGPGLAPAELDRILATLRAQGAIVRFAAPAT